MILSGVFDELPELQIILGIWREAIPSGWTVPMKVSAPPKQRPRRSPKSQLQFPRDGTSGFFRTERSIAPLMPIGLDRVKSRRLSLSNGEKAMQWMREQPDAPRGAESHTSGNARRPLKL